MKRGGMPVLFLAVLLAIPATLRAQTLYHEPDIAGAMTGFGGAVAVGNDVVFVGEAQNEITPGMVYVYRKAPQRTTWTEAAKLSATGGKPGDRFGISLGLDGGTLLVGATNADSTRGAVYIFQRGTAGRWTQSARLVPAELEAGFNFGGAIALAEDLVLVSALGRDSLAGAVYVFRRSGTGWAESGRLVGSDTKRGDRFGSSIALGNGYAFIGAPRHNDQAGAVYVFQRDPTTGDWREVAKVVGRNVVRNNWFGAAVAFNQGSLMVGAPRFNSFSGGVFVFAKDSVSNEWGQTGQLVPFDGGNAQFGAAIAWSGDESWIGAPAAGNFAGRIYQFRRDSTGEWLGATKLTARGGERGDFFASTVAMRGNTAVVGVTGDDYGAGTALIFERSAQTGWRERSRVLSPDVGYDAIVNGQKRCDAGNVEQFRCQDVDLLSFLPVRMMGGSRGVQLSGMWGWTDPRSGREFALMGRMDGTSFVEVTDPANPRYLGDLPRTPGAFASVWREMKTYTHYAFIVSDGSGEHGMQIVDLNQLLEPRSGPVTFKEAAHYDRIHSAHNIVINEQTGYAYLVGGSSGGETCGGSYHIVNIQDPLHPAFIGCFGDKTTGRASTGYSHDAQCVTYHGPDSAYTGHEICIGSNETAISITDVTDKQSPKVVSKAAYPNVGYAHQGWLTDDQRYFFMDDELDEIGGSVKSTRTLVWDLGDLDDPTLAKEFLGTTSATDHNLYLRGNRMYQSNYVAGLRVIDISDPVNPKEVGYFDTVPYGDNVPGFGGTWSNYPFFKNGVVGVTSRREGLFLLRPRPSPVP